MLHNQKVVSTVVTKLLLVNWVVAPDDIITSVELWVLLILCYTC